MKIEIHAFSLTNSTLELVLYLVWYLSQTFDSNILYFVPYTLYSIGRQETLFSSLDMGREQRELWAKRDWDETRTRQGVSRAKCHATSRVLEPVSRLDPDPFFVHTTIMRSLSLHALRTVRERTDSYRLLQTPTTSLSRSYFFVSRTYSMNYWVGTMKTLTHNRPRSDAFCNSILN